MGHLTKIANRIAQNAEGRTNSDLIKEKLKSKDYKLKTSKFIFKFLHRGIPTYKVTHIYNNVLHFQVI